MQSKQITSAVRSCVAALASVLAYAADFQTVKAEASADISGEIRNALVTMRADFATDTGAYLTAVERVYGNGRPSKAKDWKGGDLRDALTAGGVDPNTVKFYVGQARKVAHWLADPVNRDKANAEKLELRTMYKLALAAGGKAKTTRTAAPQETVDALKSAAASVVSGESIEQYLARVGLPVVLRAAARMLASDAKTKIDALAVEAIVAHLK